MPWRLWNWPKQSAVHGTPVFRNRAPIGYVLATGFTVMCVLAGGCGVVIERDGPGEVVAAGTAADARPRPEPRSRYGNPDSYEVYGQRYSTLKSSAGFRERGIASWYGKKFHGRRTSSGEVYDMYKMTAAHRELPLPTYVEVTNLENGRSAVVKVNDRGPFHENRIIDLSYAAALKLGVAEKGTAFVEVVALDQAAVRASATGGEAKAPVDSVALYLQIGAFNERRNADRLSARVAGVLPKNVRVREAVSGDSAVYRVQVGPIASVDVADRLVAALFSLGISEHHFVTN